MDVGDFLDTHIFFETRDIAPATASIDAYGFYSTNNCQVTIPEATT
jgi:hypothetical protein